MECKNCGEQTKNNNIYCSYTCRNIYVNKNLRDYRKIQERNDKKRKLKKDLYYNNPKYCKNCENVISFENRRFSFCNHSCSASYTNKERKGKYEYNLSDNGKKVLVESAFKNLNNLNVIKKDNYIKKKEYYYKEPTLCLNCDNVLKFNKRNNKFCNIDCKREYFSKKLKEFDMYKSLSRFKFDLKKYEDNFDFNLIEKYGWYKAKNNGDNVNGVSRDHIFSVNEGFKNIINPLLLAHPANCEIIKNRKNQSKNDKCSLTIDELLKKIEMFDKKYGDYYENKLKVFIKIEELKDLYAG